MDARAVVSADLSDEIMWIEPIRGPPADVLAVAVADMDRNARVRADIVFFEECVNRVLVSRLEFQLVDRFAKRRVGVLQHDVLIHHNDLLRALLAALDSLGDVGVFVVGVRNMGGVEQVLGCPFTPIEVRSFGVDL